MLLEFFLYVSLYSEYENRYKSNNFTFITAWPPLN